METGKIKRQNDIKRSKVSLKGPCCGWMPLQKGFFDHQRIFGSISDFEVSPPDLLPFLWPWVVIPFPAGAQSRFLLGTVSPGRDTVSHTALTQGSTTGLSAQEHLGMHHSHPCLALSPLWILKTPFSEQSPIAPGTQGLFKVTLYTAFPTPRSEKKTFYNGRTATCGGNLPWPGAGELAEGFV